jgi:hypothetical protein
MTGSSRLAAAVAVGLLTALGACSGSSGAVAPSGPPMTSASGEPAASVEHATHPPAAEEFCTRFGQGMSTLHEGQMTDRQAALTDLETLLAAAPAEFRTWSAAMGPWVRAQLDNDSDAVDQATEASEAAAYQIANRCQFLLID